MSAKKEAPRKGAVISTTTTVSLQREEIAGTGGGGLNYFGDPARYHLLPLSALQDFVDSVHEVIGSGAEELGTVRTSDGGITFYISDTLKENIK